MVTTLYLIRHGETEGSEERRYKGTIDVPLSERGMRQMERVAAFMVERVKDQGGMQDVRCKIQDKKNHTSCIGYHASTSNFSAVYCSDLIRAVKGAEIIAEPFRVSPVKINELRERNFGVWEGMSFDEIKEKYPKDFSAWVRNPLRFIPTGGESTLEVKERCMNTLDKIVGNHNGENIAIVAHGGVNRIVLCQYLGIPLENIFRIEQDYGCLNVIDYFEDGIKVVKLLNGGPNQELNIAKVY